MPKEMLEQKLQTLPDAPGVYRFFSADHIVLYVGKATSLKSRVRSYFTGMHTTKTQILVNQIADIEVTVTDNPFEALLLENTLIKKYKPKYNILLKDDRYYPYLKITDEKFPRLLMVYRAKSDNSRYFGPYASATEAELICQVLNEAYPIVKRPVCGKQPPCLYYHLGMCLSPYHFDVNPEEYKQMLDHIAAFLRGNRAPVMARLRDKMNREANLQHYEAAMKLRDQIERIEKIHDKQKVILDSESNLDALGYAVQGDLSCFYLMIVRNGVLLDFFATTADSHQNIFEDIREFIERYYIDKPVTPSTILLPVPLKSEIFTLKGLSPVVPKRGSKRRLLELAAKNARVYLERHP